MKRPSNRAFKKRGYPPTQAHLGAASRETSGLMEYHRLEGLDYGRGHLFQANLERGPSKGHQRTRSLVDSDSSFAYRILMLTHLLDNKTVSQVTSLLQAIFASLSWEGQRPTTRGNPMYLGTTRTALHELKGMLKCDSFFFG